MSVIVDSVHQKERVQLSTCQIAVCSENELENVKHVLESLFFCRIWANDSIETSVEFKTKASDQMLRKDSDLSIHVPLFLQSFNFVAFVVYEL